MSFLPIRVFFFPRHDVSSPYTPNGSPFDSWQTRNVQLTRAWLTRAHVRHNQTTCRKPPSIFRSPHHFLFSTLLPLFTYWTTGKGYGSSSLNVNTTKKSYLADNEIVFRFLSLIHFYSISVFPCAVFRTFKGNSCLGASWKCRRSSQCDRFSGFKWRVFHNRCYTACGWRKTCDVPSITHPAATRSRHAGLWW